MFFFLMEYTDLVNFRDLIEKNRVLVYVYIYTIYIYIYTIYIYIYTYAMFSYIPSMEGGYPIARNPTGVTTDPFLGLQEILRTSFLRPRDALANLKLEDQTYFCPA